MHLLVSVCLQSRDQADDGGIVKFSKFYFEHDLIRCPDDLVLDLGFFRMKFEPSRVLEAYIQSLS